MKKCPKCGTEYDDNIKFCQADGTELEVVKEMKKCPSCGEENISTAKFCNNCGDSFNVVEQKCEKCGKTFKDGSKFCNECGGKVVESVGKSFKQRLEEVTTKYENEKRKVLLEISSKYESEKQILLNKLADVKNELETLKKSSPKNNADEFLTSIKDDFVLIEPSDMDSYYISKYQVTQELYYAVMKENPCYFSGKKCPVENVSWYDAIYFCNILSEKLGLEPVYSIDGEKIPTQWGYKPHKGNEIERKVEQDLFADGFRLPTEAEWEYAAKGGENYDYSGSNCLDEIGWYGENSDEKTHPVGQKKANGYGIYDMSGNVWEWCWEQRCSFRVQRGGAFNYGDDYCAVDYRSHGDPGYRSNLCGFRLVCTAN